MTDQPKFTDDQLVERYIQLRDFLAAEAAAQAKYIEPHVKGMAAISGELHRRLLERNPGWRHGVKASGSTEHGTFFLKTTTSVKMADRHAFWDFLTNVPVDTLAPAGVRDVIRENMAQFLTAHVAKEAVEAYIEERENTPPGVTVEYITECQVRKT